MGNKGAERQSSCRFSRLEVLVSAGQLLLLAYIHVLKLEDLPGDEIPSQSAQLFQAGPTVSCRDTGHQFLPSLLTQRKDCSSGTDCGEGVSPRAGLRSGKKKALCKGRKGQLHGAGCQALARC